MDDTFPLEERRKEHRTALRGFLSVGDVLSYLPAAFGQIVFDILLVSWTESLESLESKRGRNARWMMISFVIRKKRQLAMTSLRLSWRAKNRRIIAMCFSNNRILCLFWSQHGIIFQKCNNGNEDRNVLENKSCHPLQFKKKYPLKLKVHSAFGVLWFSS